MLKIFKALADLNRLRILNILARRELCVCEIEVILNLSQTNVSRHLAKLREAELIEAYKDAQWVHYKPSRALLQNQSLNAFLQTGFAAEEPFVTDAQRLQNYQNNNLTCTIIREDREQVIKIIGVKN
ncbi:MAG: metalloregulator ArsR/SmtB family transcription factor [Candidatus Cloacimonadales bacterium]